MELSDELGDDLLVFTHTYAHKLTHAWNELDMYLEVETFMLIPTFGVSSRGNSLGTYCGRSALLPGFCDTS